MTIQETEIKVSNDFFVDPLGRPTITTGDHYFDTCRPYILFKFFHFQNLAKNTIFKWE